ncbi:UNVERIFIED_CONTAM: hypothetical protein GTU68_055035 [Idotea baltica]|nr:hypothetical protein [Idotea baltica]
MKKTLQILQDFSIPLIAGVVVALVLANVSPDFYRTLIEVSIFDYTCLHFLANDIVMAFFFGIAAKEITEACLPNGALNPVSKAVNPLFGTMGGVLGPIGVFLALNAVTGQADWKNGWGIPTATDIALAWLVARLIFGNGHSAVSFLLLLAVADDAIGLGIIAFGYPDPEHPTVWSNLLWLIPGMGVAFGLRVAQVKSWVPYILIGGAFSWWALYSAHLHPALALVFIVPFLPGPKKDLGLYVESADEHSPLENFEHHLKLTVDFGLFFFALANAGVPFSEVNGLTWILLAALIVGKTIGIVGFSWVAVKLGFPLPAGMQMRHLFVTGLIAALGLTVALFVSEQAFTNAGLKGAAKMGAVMSAVAAIIAWMAARGLGIRPESPEDRALIAEQAKDVQAPTPTPEPATINA